jgi:hypothetical protein
MIHPGTIKFCCSFGPQQSGLLFLQQLDDHSKIHPPRLFSRDGGMYLAALR